MGSLIFCVQPLLFSVLHVGIGSETRTAVRSCWTLRCEALLEEMVVGDHVAPTVVSFNSATSSAMGASAWQVALLLWCQMPKQRIQPDAWTCRALQRAAG